MNFQLLCLPSLTLGIASLLFLQFLCGFGELYARQSAVGCCAVSLLIVTPTPWRGGWALPGREGAFSWLCPLVWVGSRQQCSLQAVSGSSPGWRELGSLMARAVLAVLPRVIKRRGCCTSPLDPQSESLDLSRSRALQLRAEVSPWEGVVLFQTGSVGWYYTVRSPPGHSGDLWDTGPVVDAIISSGDWEKFFKRCFWAVIKIKILLNAFALENPSSERSDWWMVTPVI